MKRIANAAEYETPLDEKIAPIGTLYSPTASV